MTQANENIRYEPDDRYPHLISAGLGFQITAITLAPVAVTVAIIGLAADQPENYITWAVFAAVVVSGIVTILQAVRVGRVGAGHILVMGTSGAFIGVCITALVEGGPATLASLVVVSSLFQFLLSGLAGTVPNTTYSSSISVVTITGIAARRVGVYTGLFFILLVFSPKVVAAILAIPNVVAAAYMMVLIALIFVEGFRIVARDGMDPRKAMVVGVSFWVGVGFENKVIFPELWTGPLGALLGNGMTTGTLCAILLTLFLELTSSRRRRLSVSLAIESLPKIDEFLREFASKIGWNETSTNRRAPPAKRPWQA